MIHVVDYGVGNVGSVLNMIKKVGGQAKATGDHAELRAASKLLLPGVGSFDAAMQKLNDLDLTGLLREKAKSGTPFLGICLGMQLLAGESAEGKLPGLDLVPGKVKRFDFGDARPDLKIPHMGWNLIGVRKQHALTKGLDAGSKFYFVHSYHFVCADQADALLETEYGGKFTSGVQRENVMGVQFHPEKSHRFGMQLMQNFVEL
jgi:glutamine amidotransferase